MFQIKTRIMLAAATFLGSGLLATNVHAAAITYLQENFEEAALNGKLAASSDTDTTSMSPAVGSVQVSIGDDGEVAGGLSGSGQSLHMLDNNENGYLGLDYTFDNGSPSQAVFSFDTIFMPSSYTSNGDGLAKNANPIDLTIGTTATGAADDDFFAHIRLRQQTYGINVMASNEDGDANIVTYDANLVYDQAYTFEITADINAGNYDIVIKKAGVAGSIFTLADQPMVASTVTNYGSQGLGFLRIGSSKNWGAVDGSYVGLDNILVTSVPEPSSLGMLVGGALLLLRRRKHG